MDFVVLSWFGGASVQHYNAIVLLRPTHKARAMNGYRIAVIGPVSLLTTAIMLSLVVSGKVSARELAWKSPRIARESQKPRQFDAVAPKPLANEAVKKADNPSKSAANPPVVVELKTENNQKSRLEQIPTAANYPQVATYREATTRPRPQIAQVHRTVPQTRQGGRSTRPQQRSNVVQPWHPDLLYADSGAGLRVAQRDDSSVLNPEQIGPVEIMPEEISPGEIIDPEAIGSMEPGSFAGDCCGECDSYPCECIPCDPMCNPDWGYPQPCQGGLLLGWLHPTLEFATFSLGVDGFKSSPDRGINGNFGVDESINLAGSWLNGIIGWQVGARFIQSDFNGFRTFPNGAGPAGQITEYRPDRREQDFLTVGFFRRADEFQPWQAGIAIDFLQDHYYYKTDLSQVRLELSHRFWCRLDFGTWVALSTDTEPAVKEHRPNPPFGPGGLIDTVRYQAADQYTLFLRWAFPNGGEARLYGGGSDYREGIIGGDFWTPMSHSFAFTGNFGYLLKDKKGPLPHQGAVAQAEDAYGVALNFVWYPRKRARTASESLYRPLFEVANNGNFFIRRN